MLCVEITEAVFKLHLVRLPAPTTHDTIRTLVHTSHFLKTKCEGCAAKPDAIGECFRPL